MFSMRILTQRAYRGNRRLLLIILQQITAQLCGFLCVRIEIEFLLTSDLLPNTSLVVGQS